MSRSPAGFFLPLIALYHESQVPLYRQLYEALRQEILKGVLRKGIRLPSTRYLAGELGVSRNIVVIAFEQLLAEGYVESRTGAGTFVTRTLPEDVLQVQARSTTAIRRLSGRGSKIREFGQVPPATPPRLRFAPFRFGLPALDHLPFELWGKMLMRQCRRTSPALSIHVQPAGNSRLREAIASYVGIARGVRCTPEQVVVTNGSQQAIELAARVLADPGDHAVVEDPGYTGARFAIEAAGLKLLPLNVEVDGLCVQKLPDNKNVRFAYVTPSHQFPMGVVLSLPKRLHLLDWGQRNGAWIVEDDFDSEFRYENKPIPALQGLDENGRVIYVGTFSKVFLPSLRLGYMIVPPDLTDAFIAARCISGGSSPHVEQAAMADFITEGHLAAHIRRMRMLYMERRAVMMSILRNEFSDIVDCGDAAAGMHTLAWLKKGFDEVAIAKSAAENGINILPVSGFALHPLSRGGLLLGYAGFSPRVISKALRELGRIIRHSGARAHSRIVRDSRIPSA